MGIPFRNNSQSHHPLASQSGQAIVEYILILVVVVGVGLGMIYQFNDSFRIWANNYFGNYVACLLETGELPSIDGSSGDSTLCKQEMNAFDPKSGKGQTLSGPSASGSSSAAGMREASAGTKSSSSGIGSSGRGSGGAFGRGSSERQLGGGSKKMLADKATNTGNTDASGYGGHYGALNRRLNTGVRYRLDNKFAFENNKEDNESARSPTSIKAKDSQGKPAPRLIVNSNPKFKKIVLGDDQPMTFGGFMRFIIIAAILLALIVFIGGQMLQIGKSME